LNAPGAKCSLENGESSDCPYSCYWVVWVTLKLDSNFAFSFVCFPQVKGRYLSGCDSRVADCPSQKQGKRTRVFEAATGNTGITVISEQAPGRDVGITH
jgi:hypothetical protein